jgi:hypothetical protein
VMRFGSLNGGSRDLSFRLNSDNVSPSSNWTMTANRSSAGVGSDDGCYGRSI